MKNFNKIYKCISEIENNTIYKFKEVNEFDEYIFVSERGYITEEYTITDGGLFLTNDANKVNNLIFFDELVLFIELMKALKESK